MAKRKWVVPVVYEFYPSQANLLGLNYNRGESIKIRLRRASNKASFYPFESILHTLLHELTHIVHGPHDASFYKLLDELIREAEHLPAAGSGGGGGGGFAGGGHRLDPGRRAVPRQRAGSAAAAAAARRAQKQSIMGSGRLGGDSDGLSRICDPRELALAAAERRRKDDVWCASAAGREGAAGTSGRSGGGSSREASHCGGGGGCGEVVEVIEIDDEEEAGVLNSQSAGRVNSDGVIEID